MFDSPVDEIKQKIDIADLISEYFPLKQAGANFKARCPFHQERTPSFMVSRERQIFKCFGCGEGGDIFKFIMKMEGMEFGDALRFLAKKAGVELKRQNPQLQTKRAKLQEICELASQFYHQAFLGSRSGQIARDYVKERKIDDLMIDQFRLGFAPDRWGELYKFLKRKGYNDADILDSGLVVKKQSQAAKSFFDRFRHRLIFPIWDAHHHVIGFGGRILPGFKFLNGEEPSKYINTPQTFLYDKSRVLYGLNFAKSEIRRQKKTILVEGYMDVIASHQAGVTNAVAASGTALTFYQIQLLKRFSENVVLAFDMDLAGDSATKRGIDLAVSLGLNVKIARGVEGKDPDEFIRSKGKEAWQKASDNAFSIMDYYFTSTLKNLDKNNVDDKKKAAAVLLSNIANLPNPIEQTHYLQKLAREISVPEEDLRESFEAHKKRVKKFEAKEIGEVISLEAKKDDLLLVELLSLILKHPRALDYVKSKLSEDYLEGDFKILYKKALEEYNEEQEINFDEFSRKLKKSNPNLAPKLGEIYLYSEKEEAVSLDLEKEAERLTCRYVKEVLKEKLQGMEKKMMEAEQQGDKEKIKNLSFAFNQISQKITSLTCDAKKI